jgi:uncharacterized SAM-binding protein YcdF (DUF218 family)
MPNISYSILMPPTIFIVVCLAGALIALVRRRIGTAVMLVGSISLYLSAMPVTSCLLQGLPGPIAVAPDTGGAEAIVVLAADAHPGGADGHYRVGERTLERLAIAARLHRRLKLPLAVSGGPIGDANVSAAQLMQTELEENFAVPVRWREDRSRNTFENAEFTSRMLKADQIARIIVVTQGTDIARAIWSFERAGLHPMPWPTSRTSFGSLRVADFLPDTRALRDTFYALHELIGLAYYRIRY